MIEITPTGQRRLQRLTEIMLSIEAGLLYPKANKSLRAKAYRISPKLTILRELDCMGPQPREHFCWDCIEEGFAKIHNRARLRALDELIAKGYIREI